MTQQEFEKVLKGVLKHYNKQKPEIPERVLDFSTDRLINMYQKAYSRILNILVEGLRYTGGDFNNISNMTQMELLRQIEQILNDLDVQVQGEVETYINQEYVNGMLNHYVATTGITDYNEILNNFPFATINWYKANQLLADTMDDLLFATNNTKKSIKRVVREITTKHLQLNALQGESYKTIKRLIIKDLQKEGLSKTIKENAFVGIVDKGGKRWGLKNYSDMVVKTKTHQAYIEGLKTQALETGKDLALIPKKGAVDPCKNFEGIIISLNGLDPNYPSYEQLKATNLIFHPRCKHNPIPIGSIDQLHDDHIKDHEQAMDQLYNLTGIKRKPKPTPKPKENKKPKDEPKDLFDLNDINFLSNKFGIPVEVHPKAKEILNKIPKDFIKSVNKIYDDLYKEYPVLLENKLNKFVFDYYGSGKGQGGAYAPKYNELNINIQQLEMIFDPDYVLDEDDKTEIMADLINTTVHENAHYIDYIITRVMRNKLTKLDNGVFKDEIKPYSESKLKQALKEMGFKGTKQELFTNLGEYASTDFTEGMAEAWCYVKAKDYIPDGWVYSSSKAKRGSTDLAKAIVKIYEDLADQYLK